MNKYLQFVFLLLFVSIISYSQQGLGYYIGYNDVPKEFKERYFAKGHPDFYPKHVGDLWQYVYYDPFVEQDFYYEIKIVGDTVINGKTYYERADRFYRTKEGSTPEDYGVEYILDIDDKDDDGIYNEDLLVDSLSAQLDVEYFSYGFSSGAEPHFISDSSWYVIFDDTLLSIEVTGIGGEFTYTDKLWITQILPDLGYFNGLSGAIIDGIVYGTIVDVEEEGNELPVNYRLSQNYPNPFNPTTTIEYSIPNVGAKDFSPIQNVQLKIYDVLGREITTLVNEKQSPGNYSVKFDASNLPSGIYFYTLRAGNFVATKKMILMK